MWCPLVFGLTYGLFNILYIVAFNGTDPFGHDYVYSIIGPVHLKQGYTYTAFKMSLTDVFCMN